MGRCDVVDEQLLFVMTAIDLSELRLGEMLMAVGFGKPVDEEDAVDEEFGKLVDEEFGK
jgi:hypothetical protein